MLTLLFAVEIYDLTPTSITGEAATLGEPGEAAA